MLRVIHMEVGLGVLSKGLLTAVYANPHPNLRKYLWEQVEELDKNVLWILVGDFNCILVDAERSSKRGASTCF